MIKIPSTTKKHSVSSGSDLFGTIQYTKNINLDEEGYIKLSSRSVSLFNEGDVANLRLPVAFGRGALFTDSVDFAITQTGQTGYWLTLLETGNTLNVDSDASKPTLTVDSGGAWFQNLWHVTDDTELYTKAGLADTQVYTAKSASLTSGKVHDIEVFRNRNKICVTNGNTVKQFDTSYSASTTLTLPTDFEAMKLSYSNNKMGVIANLSDTTTGKNQNQEAFFFVWDGASTSASGGFPMGTDKAIGICAYKGSWLILTRTGQLRYFNGGGWDDIGALPFYYQKLLWGTAYTRDIYGDMMSVEGDRIFINVNGLFTPHGKKYEKFSVNNPAGILCYDPNIGIYNRYTPSISPANVITVTSGNINTTTNVLTKTAGTLPPTGSPIKYIYDKASLIGGLNTPTVYYIIKTASTTFKLATSKENADAGVAIDITSTGAANNYFLALDVIDYGASYANTTGAIAQLGNVNTIYDHLLFGAELNDYASTGNYNHLIVTCPDFDNRGYFVTPKIQASEMTSNTQKAVVKYRTLKTNDKIIVKYKDKDILGLPISTPQARSSAVNQCSWTSTDAFSTTADLSDALTAYTAGNELECEIIAGAGAGSMVKISSIAYDTGTYSVQLAEDVDGAAASRYCDVVIDNWKVAQTITSADASGYVEVPIATTSPWIKFKVELRGVDTTVEELQVINSPQIKSK